MFVYWMLLAFPAIFALAYPVQIPREQFGATQSFILYFFMVLYVLIGTFRVQVGADWVTYEYMLADIGSGGFEFALERIDPAYGALNWVSARVGGGITWSTAYAVYCWPMAPCWLPGVSASRGWRSSSRCPTC